MADYNQGRRYGNSNGTAGAFGQSTGFGGFGQQSNTASSGFGGTSSTGSLFGANNASSSAPFGGSTQASSGSFGLSLGQGNQGSTGGSLFGNNATTGAQSGGNLFGTAGSSGFGGQQSSGGFGANANNQQTGGGLFAGNQPKPGGLFGTSAGTSSGGLFSGTATAGGGFGAGSNTGSSLFGQNQNQNQNQGGGAFGSTQQQQQPAAGGFGQASSNPFSGAGFGGNNQQQQPKPSLFGAPSTNTGGSVFGGAGTQNQQQQGGGLFQNAQSGNPGPSLFAKPASTSSPFGQNQNQGGGLGGGLFNTGNQNQQNQGPSLFNTANQQQQPKPSLFGAPAGGGGGLFNNPPQASTNNNAFGATNTNQGQNNSLFGASQNNQQGGSIFGASQPNALAPPQAFTATLNDAAPYGSASIFNGLPPPPQHNLGPIATPITAGTGPRKVAALPQYKLNPGLSATARLTTPQKRGFGFSYSTYGTPSSAMSVASSPGGFGSSFLGGSIGRSLGKSLSTSNLRHAYGSANGESILSPGALSGHNGRYGVSGSMKKLTIDRSIRSDIFSSPIPTGTGADKGEAAKPGSSLKKRVSFDTNTAGGNANGQAAADGANGNTRDQNSADSDPRASSRSLYPQLNTNGGPSGSRASTGPQQADFEVQGNELAPVPEDDDTTPPRSRPAPKPSSTGDDPELGEYWSRPSLAALKRLTREQLKAVPDLTVGRVHGGSVRFERPVDMTNFHLERLYGDIVEIVLRKLTVYPFIGMKPVEGRGLNVPATITLENSWPRERDRKTACRDPNSPRVAKHVAKLKTVEGAQFVDYDRERGHWSFHVKHFTTYGLDYDSEGEVDPHVLKSSALSEAPPSTNGNDHTMEGAMDFTSSALSEGVTRESSDPEDTFHFMKVKKDKVLPGAFGGRADFDIDEDDQEDQEPEMEEATRNGESFLEERSAGSPSERDEDEPSEHDAGEMNAAVEDGSFTIQDDDVMNVMDALSPVQQEEPALFPESILKTSRMADRFEDGTPTKPSDVFDAGGWTEQLQRTVSPRKRDRQALRESQALLFRDSDIPTLDAPKLKALSDAGEIATSIDLMNSLFGHEQARRSTVGKQAGAGKKGFEV